MIKEIQQWQKESGNTDEQSMFDVIALIDEEINELWAEFSFLPQSGKVDKTKIAKEMADVIVVFCAMAEHLDIDLQAELQTVHALNKLKVFESEHLACVVAETWRRAGIKARPVQSKSGKWVVRATQDGVTNSGKAVAKGKMLKSCQE